MSSESSSADHLLVQKVNTSLVLNALRAYDRMSPAHVAEQLGLTSDEADDIITDLIARKFIRESTEKADRVELNPDGGFTIGIEFAVESLRLIMTDFVANVVWEATVQREIDEAEAKSIARAEELIDQAEGVTVEIEEDQVTLSFDDLARVAGNPVVVDVEKTFRQQVLDLVANPNIAYFLMMAAMLGLYMEFSNPGVLFPGVVGAICLLLALLAFQVLPISSTGVLLLVLGMAFMIGELLMPSFGMLGFGGLIALTLGSLILYTPESGLIVDRTLILATTLLFGGALALIVLVLVRDRRRPPVTGAEGLVGETGVAVTQVHRNGRVKVHGELWNARSDEPIDDRSRVRVDAVDGLEITVSELKE